MSIIGSNRHVGKHAHDWVSASLTAARNEPTKRDLRQMLAEAARNTAALPIEPGVASQSATSLASAPNPIPGPGADAFIREASS